MILDVDGPDGVRPVRLSNPSRVLWPQAGLTKPDLARYPVDVAPAFLRANGGRPVPLQPFGGDVDGGYFFSENPPQGAPDDVRSVTVFYPDGRSHPQLVLDEPASAVRAIQTNTVVFHPWASRADAPDLPDELRIDLDPQPGTIFADVVAAARELRAVLHGVGLACLVKTSGNRGLHAEPGAYP